MSANRPTTRSSLDRELQAIQDDMLRMGEMVIEAIQSSLRALAERDRALAQQVVDGDAKVNRLRFDIEEACLALMATQQPAAGDLRAVVAAMNIVVDLERMGDHAAGNARIVLRMGDEPLLKPLIDIPRMADVCRSMIRDSLQAFIRRDGERARQIAAMDDQIDGLYQQVFRELLSFMVEDPKTTGRALSLLFAAHNLERIGDRATNIAERVLFMTSGVMRELNPEPHEAHDHE
ncbi:MAG TPA: phosphate signaling complex protein PhoU [Anaerolineales bacterium]|nr:phosphate signaling complex protein PhoU [Anaerolineales bacterium]